MNGTSTTPIPIEGAGTLILDAYDNGEPGSGGAVIPDQIGITVKNKSGRLWYTTNTYNSTTSLADPLPLGGGNIQIRTGAALSTQSVTMNNIVQEQATDVKFGLKVAPNPTSAQFNVHLESSNTTEKISLRVFDASGRTVQVLTNLYAGQTVQLGNTYKPGIYFVEMLQGNSRKQMKLLKAVN
jgi:hypothetical protein